jgi:phosphatidylinositol glycan class T
MPFLPILLAFLPFLPKATATPSETYSETLSIRQTPDGKVTTNFAFTTDLSLDSFPSYYPSSPDGNSRDTAFYTLFPSSLGEILRKDAITEMHMSLNSGKWDYERWGYEEGVGTGGEVRSWIADLGDGEDR